MSNQRTQPKEYLEVLLSKFGVGSCARETVLQKLEGKIPIVGLVLQKANNRSAMTQFALAAGSSKDPVLYLGDVCNGSWEDDYLDESIAAAKETIWNKLIPLNVPYNPYKCFKVGTDNDGAGPKTTIKIFYVDLSDFLLLKEAWENRYGSSCELIAYGFSYTLVDGNPVGEIVARAFPHELSPCTVDYDFYPETEKVAWVMSHRHSIEWMTDRGFRVMDHREDRLEAVLRWLDTIRPKENDQPALWAWGQLRELIEAGGNGQKIRDGIKAFTSSCLLPYAAIFGETTPEFKVRFANYVRSADRIPAGIDANPIEPLYLVIR